MICLIFIPGRRNRILKKSKPQLIENNHREGAAVPGFFERILSPMRIRKLKQQYITMHRGTKTEAENALARQLSLLKNKRPGQREEWYLEKIIYELEKDRRT